MSEFIGQVSKFVSINSGGQVLLENGSCWRVGLNYQSIVAQWKVGDRIEIGEDAKLGFRIKLLNLERGDYANALPSRQI
jgi:hypothetical protein